MFLLDYLMDKLGYQKKSRWDFPAPKKPAVKRVIKKTAVKKPRKPK
jgi:hypothetical protein